MSGDRGDSIARTSRTLFVARIVASLGFFVVVVILARGLGPSGRGVLAFSTVLALLIAKVASVGLGGSAVYYAARRPNDRAVLLSTHVVFVGLATLGLVGVVVGVLLVFAEARPPGVDDMLLLLLIPATVLTGLTEWSLAFLLGARRVRAQGLGLALGPWGYVAALAAVGLFAELDVTTAAVAWVVGYLGWALLLLSLSVHAVGFARPRWALLRESLAFGVRAWGGGLARTVNTRADQLLMAYLSTQAALGVYAVAVNVSEVLLYAPGAIAMALAPVIATAESSERMSRTLGTFRVALLITVATLVPAVVLGPLLIPVVFGEAFRASVVPFLILAPAAIGFLTMRLFSSALMGSSLPGRSSLPAVTALVTGVILVFVLVPPYAEVGAAMAASAAAWTGGVTALAIYRHATGFRAIELLPRRADVTTLIERSRGVRRSTSAR